MFSHGQRAYRGEGFSALFTFCPNCPAIISPRILGKIGAVVGVPRACQKFWGFFCLVVCSSLPDGSGRLMEGPTWQTQNVNKAEKHTPKVDAACIVHTTLKLKTITRNPSQFDLPLKIIIFTKTTFCVKLFRKYFDKKTLIISV